jgi:ERCC4-type nuclease
LIIVHKYHVIFTKNHQDTMEKIYSICSKIGNDVKCATNSKLLGKDHSVENVFMHQLACIPGITIDTAKILVQEFKHLPTLLQVLRDSKESLKCIQLNDKRKISNGMIEKLVKYLLDVHV